MEETATKITFSVELPAARENQALVVHCSAPEVQQTVDEFLKKGLNISCFSRIAVPGGPEFFLAMRHLPKFGWAGKRWAEFIVNKHTLKKIVCISHEDCRWYSSGIKEFLKLLGHDMKQKQLKDLIEVRSELLKMFPCVEVLLYYEEHEGGKANFIPIG